MAKPITGKTPYVNDIKVQKIYVDGIEIPESQIRMGIYTYDMDAIFEIVKDKESNVLATITSGNDKLQIHIHAYETDNNGNVYIYGPLRRMFPAMFKDKELHIWQLAYCETWKDDPLLKYKLWRDDPFFTSNRAITFKEGFLSGVAYENKQHIATKG